MEWNKETRSKILPLKSGIVISKLFTLTI